MPQSQPTANPRCQEEEKKDKNQYVQNIFIFLFLFLFIYFFFLRANYYFLFYLFILFYFFFFFFFYFFQHIKMSKAFTLEKSQKNAFCLWHVRLFILLFMAYAEPVYSLFRTPTLPYGAQPLLYATGKMSLNWGLDCSSICSMYTLVVNCLPSFGRAIGWTVKYEWRKSTGNHEFFRESNTCIWNNDVTLYFFGSVKGFLLIS